MQAGVLREAEDKVHVLDGLAGSTLDKIVDNADYVKLPSMFPDIKDALVGVDHHFEVRIAVDDMDEWFVLVIIFVQRDSLPFIKVTVKIDR